MHHLSSGQMLQQQSLRALVCATCDFTIKLLEVEEEEIVNLLKLKVQRGSRNRRFERVLVNALFELLFKFSANGRFDIQLYWKSAS